MMHVDAPLSIELPAGPAAFRDAGWDDILPYYNQLATHPIEAAASVMEPWLNAWSRLDATVSEAATLASIAYTANTADAAAEAAREEYRKAESTPASIITAAVAVLGG